MSEEKAVEFGIQRIYVKDISFESPSAPQVFKDQWSPQINLEVHSKADRLEGDSWEVTLQLTIQARKESKAVFLIEVEQAGIFTVKGVEGDELGRILGTYCPNILYPYAREVVDTLAVRGSFPALMLQPINFDALYDQERAKH
ncbi:MAG: protein-export chaperone SecB [Pseudomonadota bacterium]|jgi:preprotein translocase subunit SecB